MIFDLCSVKDLQSFKQVSKFWRDCGLNLWASKSPVQFADEDNLLEFLEFVQNADEIGLPNPFVFYRLTGSCKNNPRFWELCGPQIKTLELTGKFSTVDAFRHAIFACCPNMVKLTLTYLQTLPEMVNIKEPMDVMATPFIENRNVQSLTINTYSNLPGLSWMEILVHFPCLEVCLQSSLTI